MPFAEVLGLLDTVGFGLQTVNLFIKVHSMLFQPLVPDNLGLGLPVALLFCLCHQEGKARGGTFEKFEEPQREWNSGIIHLVFINLHISKPFRCSIRFSNKGCLPQSIGLGKCHDSSVRKLLDPPGVLKVSILDGDVHVGGMFSDVEEVFFGGLFCGLVLGQVLLQFADTVEEVGIVVGRFFFSFSNGGNES